MSDKILCRKGARFSIDALTIDNDVCGTLEISIEYITSRELSDVSFQCHASLHY